MKSLVGYFEWSSLFFCSTYNPLPKKSRILGSRWAEDFLKLNASFSKNQKRQTEEEGEADRKVKVTDRRGKVTDRKADV